MDLTCCQSVPSDEAVDLTLMAVSKKDFPDRQSSVTNTMLASERIKGVNKHRPIAEGSK